MQFISAYGNGDPLIIIKFYMYVVLICTLPGEISCSTAVSSFSGFSWFLFGLLPLLKSHLGCYKFSASSWDSLRPACLEACLLASCLKSAVASDVSRAIASWLYLRLHSGSVSLVCQGDYCAAKPPTLDPTIINRMWLTTVARCRTLQFAW